MKSWKYLAVALIACVAIATATSAAEYQNVQKTPVADVAIDDSGEPHESPYIVWPMPNPGPVPLPQPPIPKPKPEPVPTPEPLEARCDHPDCNCEDCDGDNCQCQADHQAAGLGSGPGFMSDYEVKARLEALEGRLESPGFTFDSALTSRVNRLEARADATDGQFNKLEARVTKVEEQLKAILTLRDADGTEVKQEVPISSTTGYGEHVVPGSYRVVAIDGVPVEQLQRVVVNNTPVYSSPIYSMQTTSTPRTVRVTRRGLFGWRTTSGPATCTVNPVTGVRTCR